MFPFVELKASPAGNDAEMLHEVAGEPVLRGAITEAATSLYKVNEVGEYEMFGADGTTASVREVVTLPAELVAVTVYEVAVEVRVGVPEITPF